MSHAPSRRRALLTLSAVSAICLGGLAPAAVANVTAGDDSSSTITASDPNVPTGPAADGEQGIVGGTEAPEGRWPQLAKLRVTEPGGVFGCGGTLISPNILLTAQHCLSKGPTSFKAEIYAGKKDWKQGERHQLTDWRTGRGPKYGDWAVAKLDTPVSSNVGIAVLPNDASLDTSAMFQAAGWGTTSEGGSSPQLLRQVDLAIHKGTKCSQYASAELCTEGNGTAGKDTCQGDSGGPLFAKDRAGRDVQVGITSWGIGCARAYEPGHYAKVSAYLPQILQAIDQMGGIRPGKPNPPTPPNPGPTDPTPPPNPGPTDPTPPPNPGPTDPTPPPNPGPTDPTDPAPQPGGVNSDSFSMSRGQTSGSFNVLSNDSVPAGSRVMFYNLPAGPSLYVSGRSNGALSVYRGTYMRGTYNFRYVVTTPDGQRLEATVRLVLN